MQVNSQAPVAIVTGGSSGIGEAVVRKFAQAGFRVGWYSPKPVDTFHSAV
jgi:NAD(P)-dependent dehydrogenase (short-subunit alcohol dehydrogenase family)